MTSPGTLNRPIVTVFVGAVLALSSGTSPQAQQNAVAGAPACADGGECLCDSSYQDCRSSILQLINNETVGIDVSFWFMTDWRYSSALIKRWQAGVPVRIILDTLAEPNYGGNTAVRDTLMNAGIPIRYYRGPGINHWKMTRRSIRGSDSVHVSGHGCYEIRSASTGSGGLLRRRIRA